jgi:PqqD family protein of HPr-rel-A system
VLDDLTSVVFDPQRGEAHTLNPAATAVLERCDGSLSTAEIIDAQIALFDAPPARVAEDVVAFLGDLRGRGLIGW